MQKTDPKQTSSPDGDIFRTVHIGDLLTQTHSIKTFPSHSDALAFLWGMAHAKYPEIAWMQMPGDIWFSNKLFRAYRVPDELEFRAAAFAKESDAIVEGVMAAEKKATSKKGRR